MNINIILDAMIDYPNLVLVVGRYGHVPASHHDRRDVHYMYEIAYLTEKETLLYTVSGFWSMDLLRQFQKELRPYVETAQKRRKDFKVLSDSSDFAVQSSDVAQEIGHMMNVAVKITSGRKAFVVRSALQKLQYQRIISHPTVRLFLTIDDARAWLDEAE